MPVTGLEPVRGCPQGILSPWCLPFHHTGRCLYNVSRAGGGVKCAGKKDGGSREKGRGKRELLPSFWDAALFDGDQAVLGNGDGHAGLHGGQELLAQIVHHGHFGVRPHVRQDGPGGGQGVDGLGEEHAGRLLIVGADGEEHHAPGGGADGLGQAQGLAQHGLLVQIGIVLVAAFHGLVPEHQGHLIAGQGVEAAPAHQGFCLAGAGDDHTAFELLHTAPPVMISRISASVW